MTVKRFAFTPTPEKCDDCKRDLSLKEGTLMYDAKHPSGPWGCFCAHCFSNNGMSIGIGKGQSYVREADGKFWFRRGLQR